MHPEEGKPFRIGNPASPTVLVNGESYPSALGAKLDRMLPILSSVFAGLSTNVQQGGPSATFGTATLQRQYSLDGGTTWTSDGGAVSAVTPVTITMHRNALYRWQVGGTGNITAANIYIW
jgi:hypothetical protein